MRPALRAPRARWQLWEAALEIEPWIYPAMTLVAAIAGFIDAIAGGGGLLTTPAMLFAGLPPITVLATNKLQSTFGTTMAAINFARAGLLDWRAHKLAVLLIFLGSAAGALVVQLIDNRALMVVIPVLLLVAAGYVLISPRMEDKEHPPRLSERAYAPVASAIGFYDGFFGPGTGTFFNASAVALRGAGLTRATGMAKLFNLTSNLGALVVWAMSGEVIWLLGLVMAAGAIAGNWLGSHTAIRHGAPLIRPMLVFVSLALTVRVVWGYFAG